MVAGISESNSTNKNPNAARVSPTEIVNAAKKYADLTTVNDTSSEGQTRIQQSREKLTQLLTKAGFGAGVKALVLLDNERDENNKKKKKSPYQYDEHADKVLELASSEISKISKVIDKIDRIDTGNYPEILHMPHEEPAAETLGNISSQHLGAVKKGAKKER